MSIVKEVLDKTKCLRKKYEKRSNALSYPGEYEGLVTFPSQRDCYKISLGYLERFLIMADHKKLDGGLEKGLLKIEQWNEGCGFFSGKYSIVNGTEKVKSGSFEWSGRGTIENSWNSFSKFE